VKLLFLIMRGLTLLVTRREIRGNCSLSRAGRDGPLESCSRGSYLQNKNERSFFIKADWTRGEGGELCG
jgi:hypothetical protein